ncbi:response regulator transcription factor [bacterium]|nr:response regulator transcription factor [bacterium]
MIDTIIIEDIAKNRAILKSYLADFRNINIVAEADDVQSGLKAIRKYDPKLVLLDIELGDEIGFDIFNFIPKPKFKTIVITGFNQYAIQALKCSAIDYLLKPVNKAELFDAIGNTTKVIQDEQYQLDLLSHYMNASNQVDRLIVSTDKFKKPILFNELMYLKSDGGYTFFYLSTGEYFLSSRSIQFYEDFLPKDRFFRSHKSYIVNYSFINVIPLGRGGKIPMPNGKDIQISVRRMAAFRKWFTENTNPRYREMQVK